MEPKNNLLLKVFRREAVERPPVWLMRPAGRILPQYRELRSSLDGFKALVEKPEKAAEATVQPIDDLGVDAAILFSDILVIPDAMGLPYGMKKGVGPIFERIIQNRQDIENLVSGEDAAAELEYVYQAIEETLARLDGRVPLIGFAGAPWTLLAYMIEGSGSKTFSKARAFLLQEPQLAHLLLEKLTETIIAYLQEKINHGVHVVQVFDSWAGLLSPALYSTFCMPYWQRIRSAITDVPMIIFAKGAYFAWDDFRQLGADGIGLDWTITPENARRQLGNDTILQGNFDPCILYASPEVIEKEAKAMIRAFGPNHIVNLGHGVYPDTPLENVRHFVKVVKGERY